MIKYLNVRHRAILKLSLPIIGGMISQNILNLVDAAMVGPGEEMATRILAYFRERGGSALTSDLVAHFRPILTGQEQNILMRSTLKELAEKEPAAR